MRSCLWSLNLFQSDLDKSWICVRILVARSRGETPGAHVADAVTLVVEGGERQPGIFKAVTQKLYWGRIIQTCSTCCSSNSRESLAGKPLSMAPSNRPPLWKSCRCRCCRRHPQRTSPPSAWFHQQRQRWGRPSARPGARTLARSWRPVCHSRWRRTGWRGRAGSPRCSPDSAWRSPTITPRTWVQAAPPNPNKD